MRFPPLALSLLAGCGSVRLGDALMDEAANIAPDAGDASRLDAGASSTLRVVVAVQVDDDCNSCVELSASVADGVPPYTFEWDDGSALPRRRVCAPVAQDAFTVTVTDAQGVRSQPRSTRLELPETVCAADAGVPKLCLQNLSFEGMPAINAGFPMQFDGKPWSDCTNPARANMPDIVNDTVQQTPVDVPQPTDGKTFLGLFEGEQTSQTLCASLRAGDERFVRFDVQRIDVTAGAGGQREAAALQIWGGTSANCTPLELLWASPKLSLDWQNFCAPLAPRQFMDLLTLKAISDESLPSNIYVAVDHIVQVDSCP
jgi:hypothetical protein